MGSLLLKEAEFNGVYTCRNMCGLGKTCMGLNLTSGIYQEPLCEQQPESDLDTDTTAHPKYPQVSPQKIPPTLWLFHPDVPNCTDFRYIDFRYLELKLFWTHTDQTSALDEILGILWILWILLAHFWIHKKCCPACSASHSTNAAGGLWTVSSHPFFCPICHFPALWQLLSTIKSLWSHPGYSRWTYFTDHCSKNPPEGDNSLNKTIPCKKGFGNNRECVCGEQQGCFSFPVILCFTMSRGRN